MGPVLSLFKGGYYTDKGLLPSSLKGFLGFPRGKGATLSPCFRAAGMAANRKSMDVALQRLLLRILQALSNGNVLVVYVLHIAKKRKEGWCRTVQFLFSLPLPPFIEGSKFRRKNRREEEMDWRRKNPFSISRRRNDRRRRFHGDEMGNGVMYQTCSASPPTQFFFFSSQIYLQSRLNHRAEKCIYAA